MNFLFKITIRSIFIVVLFLIGQQNSFATGQPIIQILDGNNNQLQQDSSTTVTDNNYFDNSFLAIVDTPYSVKNIVSLQINEFSNLYLRDSFTVTITARIYYRNALTAAYDSVDKVFMVNYDSTNKYQSINSFVFNGAHQVKVQILTVNSSVSWNVMPAIRLENEMIINPTYKFSCTNSAIDSVSYNVDSINTQGELYVSWQGVDSADRYDLEWTYVDSSALANGNYGSPTNPNPSLIFTNNATRVTISSTSYMVPLLYDDTGTLFFRVRPIQVDANNNMVAANWSSDYLPKGLGWFNYGGHQRNLNWQSTISFAEDGKRKIVVQYYDGSLRSRQTVTKDNTTNTTVVAETLYDNQGRPAIQVLPAPTLNNIIQYSHDFNVAGLNGGAYDATGVEYNKSLYDTLLSPANYCNQGAPPMDTSSGASQYYSTDNPQQNISYNRFIPDAKGYPFAETQYEQDNTGRISKQSGVGPMHQIGSGHETSYFYGSPDQTELDALFGTEVGVYTHYFKNMVEDANGQYSVSYVDMHGRTVATALAGQNPADMQKLNSNIVDTMQETLASPSSNVTTGLVMQSQKSLLLSSDGNNVFHYDLSPQNLKHPDCNNDTVCYHCLYNLQITITDDCNNQKIGGSPIKITRSNFTIGAIDTTCNNPAGFEVDTTIFLLAGNYEITKTLTVSNYGEDYYLDSVFMSRNICKTLQQFIQQQEAQFAISNGGNCTPSCASCTAEIGSLDTFKVHFFAGAGIPIADTSMYGAQVMAAYNNAVAECSLLCNTNSNADDIKAAMLYDVTAPSGQYANPDSTSSKYSIFHIAYNSDSSVVTASAPYTSTNIVYLNPLGKPDTVFDDVTQTMVIPQQLDVTEFVKKFDTTWAEQLLQFHPEYCKLTEYEKFQASLLWDKQFQNINTYADAYNQGYFNPIAGSNGIVSNIDPLSTAAIKNGAYYNQLSNSLNQYYNKNGLTISLWTMACMMTKCGGDATDTTCLNWCRRNAFNTDSMCTGDLNMAWIYFRQIYLGIKQNIIYADLNSTCSVPTSNSLAALGFHPNFYNASDAMSESGLGSVASVNSSNAAATENAVQDSINSNEQQNCQSYVSQWVQQLSPCNYSQTAINDTIVPILLTICQKGSDISHIYGSSSISPDSIYTYNSFEDALNDYNRQHGITNSYVCNPELITSPLPYNSQEGYSGVDIYSTPSQCQCTSINNYYTQYQINGKSDSSFSAYMLRVANTSMSDNDLNTLRSMCNATSQQCINLVAPITLPPVFQCGVTNVCASCSQVGTLYQSYLNTYGQDYAPAYLIGDSVDTVQQQENQLFANYMNNHLGFSYQYYDYLQFMAQCDSTNHSTRADSLQNILTGYQNDITNLSIPHLDANGCDTTFIKINQRGLYQDPRFHLADWMSNSIFSMPSRDTANVTGTISPSFNYEDTLCVNGNFNFESSFKFPIDTTSKNNYVAVNGYAGIYGSVFYEFHFDSLNETVWLTRGFDPTNPDSISAFVLSDNNNGIAYPDHRNIHTSLKDLSSWVDLKVDFAHGESNVYVNGELVDTKPYSSSFSKFYMLADDPYGYNMQIDWIKMFDSTNTLRYFEDFKGCDSLGKQTFPNSCGSCQQNFTNYYNNAEGSNYSYSSIDSIYYNVAGFHPNPCDTGSQAILSCDTLQCTLKSFQNFYKGIDFSQIYENRKITKCAQTFIDGLNAVYTAYDDSDNVSPSLDKGYAVAPYSNGFNMKLKSIVRPAGGYYLAAGTNVYDAILPMSLDCTLLPTLAEDATPARLDLQSDQLNLSDTDFVTPSLVSRSDLEDNYYAVILQQYPYIAYAGHIGFIFGDQSGYQGTSGDYNEFNYYGAPKPENKFLVRDSFNAVINDSYGFYLVNSSPNIITPADYNNYIQGMSPFNTDPYRISTSPEGLKRIYNLRFAKQFISPGFSNIPVLSSLGLEVSVDYNNGITDSAFLSGTYNTGFIEYQEIIDTNLYNPDCKKSFTTYFNTRFNTNYSYQQIAGLYHQCNSLITDPCDNDNGSSNGPMLCGRAAPAYPTDSLPVINSCTDSTSTSLIAGTDQYNAYQDSLVNQFDSLYRHQCLNAVNLEHFTDVHAVAEYQYTLYYYDQAGNLIKTAPPQGVVPQRRDSWYDSVATARSSNISLPNIANSLFTQYRYNTLNQVIAQQSPDGGLSHFWYDRLGRLSISQNAKQQTANEYSYTLYDSIGRIIEVGQIASTTLMADAISRNPDNLNTWFTNAANSRTQITATVYDTAYAPFAGTELNAQNLRNRVAYTSFYNTAADIGFGGQASATYYSYDIEGNVDTLVQDYNQTTMGQQNNRFKKIVYNYDLVSGKVNSVAYQANQADAFYHSYLYDAENRLINVQTSHDSINWENDAYYQYYKHGPLARTVLGQQQVQGIDYAYTLQGWLKAVNPTSFGIGNIAGDDGTSTSPVAKDEYSFALNYFDNDYAGVGTGIASPSTNIPTQLSGDNRPLYNGNIGSMAVNILQLHQPLLYNYQYDQLNRLVQMDAWKADTAFSTLSKLNDFHENVTYDANGNILSYLRNGNNTFAGKPLGMDSLTYNYNANSNQLNYVHDAVADGNYKEDIDNQTANNYHYDAIGNLTQDVKEGIDSINWTVYGKIDSIHKTDGTSIKYTYDASGNRITKLVHGTSGDVGTYYVRDASGNVMSVYETNATVNSGNLTQTETDLFGSSRLGLASPNINVQQIAPPQSTYLTNLADSGLSINFIRGLKQYELSNHLGNVLVTISDKKKLILADSSSSVTNNCVAGTGLPVLIENSRNTSISAYTASQEIDLLPNFQSVYGDNYVAYIDPTITNCVQPDTIVSGNYYKADVITAGDYYPFGMKMPGREYLKAGDSSYRYGFNGQEKSDEVEPNTTTAEYWEYDARLGRRWNLDPRPEDGVSPYAAFDNNPIWHMDILGDSSVPDLSPAHPQTLEPVIVTGTRNYVTPAAGNTSTSFDPVSLTMTFGHGTQNQDASNSSQVTPPKQPIMDHTTVNKVINKGDLRHTKPFSTTGDGGYQGNGTALTTSAENGGNYNNLIHSLHPSNNAGETNISSGPLSHTDPKGGLGVLSDLLEFISRFKDMYQTVLKNPNDKDIKRSRIECPNCQSGDSVPNINNDAYVRDVNGHITDTLKKNPSTGGVDILPVK